MRQFFVLAIVCVGAAVAFPAQQGDLQTAQQQHAPQQQGAPQGGAPPINWGKCPQLQPSDNERQSKARVIEGCLGKVSFPQSGQNATQEEVAKHREDVTTCALKTEGWFDNNGFYKFDRARSEILNKKLPANVEQTVLSKHDECKKEAAEKFQNNPVPQVQMYQACMDYHISAICEINVGGAHPQH